jgi:DNA-directed RNA polymerase subunit omega
MLERQPSVETLTARAGSRFAAVIMASRRAEQLVAGAVPVVEVVSSANALTVALEELAAGRVVAMKEVRGQAGVHSPNFRAASKAPTNGGDSAGKGDALWAALQRERHAPLDRSI